MSNWLFDVPLALGLLWVGWQTVASATLFRAVILFVVLGLLAALCWARLAAPDVALAEAAIGAGLTGALLLDAYRVLGIAREEEPQRMPVPLAVLLVVLAVLTAGGLIWALLAMPVPVMDASSLVERNLEQSGVSNPVTAVLLNFRAYDTLLEVAVLLLALWGAWAAGGWEEGLPPADSPLLDALVRRLVPLAVLIALYLLWAGAHSPGGAFQAGAVLAAAGVLLHLSGRLAPAPWARLPLRIVLVLGLGVFSAVALGVMTRGGNLLEYPEGWAGLWILAIESALTLSIAVTLTLLFSGARGVMRP